MEPELDLNNTSLDANSILGTDDDDILQGGADADTILGELGNDTILGGEGNDTLDGGAGDDIIDGEKGDDLMIGGDDNDVLIWNNGDGSDILEGGEGYDVSFVTDDPIQGDEFVLGQEGERAIFDRVNLGEFTLDANDVEQFDVNASGGDDSFVVEDLSNTDVELVSFSGGDGNDTLDASQTTTTLNAKGGEGDDLLQGGEAADKLDGDRGNDTVLGGGGNDKLLGGDGDDIIDGEKGDDLMKGGGGDDRLIWNNGDGSDVLRGSEGYDVAEVNDDPVQGDEFVLGQEGGQAIFDRVNLGEFTLGAKQVEEFEVNASGGDDSFIVEDLSNTDVELVSFSGGEGNDILDASQTATAIEADGGVGDDTLIGGAGDDILIGGDGSDLIIGNAGNDVLTGGNAADLFSFNSESLFDPANEGINLIQDFTAGEDKIGLDKSVFDALSIAEGFSLDTDFAVVTDDAEASASAAFITYSMGTGTLFYNQNGAEAGYGEGGEFAALEGVENLAAEDFVVEA